MVIPIGTGFTTKAIANELKPILLVIHSKDGTWQFLDGDPVSLDNGVIIHSDEIFLRAGMMSLMGLPSGWEAFRKSVEDPWSWYESNRRD